MPNQARFGRDLVEVVVRAVGLGVVLEKPWVISSGVVAPLDLAIRSRCCQYGEEWFGSCWSAQLSAGQPGRELSSSAFCW